MRYKETLEYARNHRKNPTPAEDYVWGKIRNRSFLGLKFNRQFIIEYKEILRNKLYYIADFHNFEYKIIIEIDGSIHDHQNEYDKEREADLISLEYSRLKPYRFQKPIRFGMKIFYIFVF